MSDYKIELLSVLRWALSAERALPIGMQHAELQRAIESTIRKIEEAE